MKNYYENYYIKILNVFSIHALNFVMCSSVIENHHQPLMCFFKEIWLNDRRICGLIWKLKIARGNFQFSIAFQLVEIQNQRERERERERERDHHYTKQTNS